MRIISTLIMILITSVSMAQKKDSLSFKIDTVNRHHIDIFPLENWENMIFFEFDNDLIIVEIKGDSLKTDKPYTVTKGHHALIIYKNGLKIGAFTYYKKAFHLTNLKSI